ncbi:hypothetical protein PSPO01_10125 [Paraphaeosphaeria sporulosa]
MSSDENTPAQGRSVRTGSAKRSAEDNPDKLAELKKKGRYDIFSTITNEFEDVQKWIRARRKEKDKHIAKLRNEGQARSGASQGREDRSVGEGGRREEEEE